MAARFVQLIRDSLCPCGYGVLNDEIELGTIYRVYPESIQKGSMQCGACSNVVDVHLITADSRSGGDPGRLPMEIFDMMGVPPAQVENPDTTWDVDAWYMQELSKNLLGGAHLVDSDEHDHGALMTTDRRWYFTRHFDDPVMTKPNRISKNDPKPIPGMFRWSLEEGVYIAATREDPEDYDIREVARFDTLAQAIIGAANKEEEQRIGSTAQSIYEQKECMMEPIYMKELEQL